MPLTDSITEWTFVGGVQSLINEIIKANPSLPFSEASIEERGRGQRKRRDLTLYDNDGHCALSGEVKLPDKADGQSPYSHGVVQDAHDKADTVGVEYFFTWNVNRFVLWKTFERGTALIEREYLFWDVVDIKASSQLRHPDVKKKIREFLNSFLELYGEIYSGKEIIRTRPLDERFIHVLEAAVEQPVTFTLYAISEKYSSLKRFKTQLNQWMRDDQGWLLSDDENIVRENLERAAKLSCYVLVNKIVFHTALRRRFSRLSKIRIPPNVDTGEELQEILTRYFAEAKRITKDYETVFDGDFGDTLPFMSDAVSGWRELVNHLDGFDFSKIDYDIIGHIFERLISPEERHRYGQHYTKTEIVDLINAFCIRKPSDVVLDPACGGGTFLVRAYARLRYLAESEPEHAKLLQQISGLDISAYPVHLSTINLATRHLIDAENYPHVARSDFFDVRPDKPVFHIPLGRAGRGGKQQAWLQVGKVDAVVGNPPYIRQEDIGKSQKEKLTEVIGTDFPGTELSGRSDIYVYFFPHSASFLRNTGSYLGLLTSIGWLDTDYGFKLQKFLLKNFQIIAVLESNCEPWFTGARVTTVVAVLRRERDPEKRNSNLVKFIQVRKLLAELYPDSPSSQQRLERAEELRDFIECCEENYLDDRWRIRVIRQEELYKQGCWEITTAGQKGVAPAGKPKRGASPAISSAPYRGGKWGVYLRAPDIYFELMDKYGLSFVPLREIAEIRRGITSGCDDFFFPKDITDNALQKYPSEREFRNHFGISKRQSKSVRIIEAGDGSVHTVEAKYLEPEVHSLMEIDSVEINPKNLKRQVLLVSDPLPKLKGTFVEKYIKWGKRQGYHQRPTCVARDLWYDLNPNWRGSAFWTKSQQYRHIVPLNTRNLICNCNLYDLRAKNPKFLKVLVAVLNSTVVCLFKHQFGRYMGREGNLKTEVIDVNMMLVPDVAQVSPSIQTRLFKAFKEIQKRKSQNLSDELVLKDRQALDDATFELIGVADKNQREQLRKKLYDALENMYKEIRVAELKMQANRREMSRRGKLTPRSIASDIWDNWDYASLLHFPFDFVSGSVKMEKLDLAPAKRIRLIDDLFQKGTLKANGHIYALHHPERALYAARLLEEGVVGAVEIPVDPRVCEKALRKHDEYKADMEQEFYENAAESTADEEWQEKIVNELWNLHRGSRHD